MQHHYSLEAAHEALMTVTGGQHALTRSEPKRSKYYSPELAQLLNGLRNVDDGFTIDLSEPGAVLRGYVVALDGFGVVIPSDVFYSAWSDDDSRCMAVGLWWERKGRIGGTQYVGAWRNSTGLLYFDAVTIVQDGPAAFDLARANNQQAIAHLTAVGAEVLYL